MKHRHIFFVIALATAALLSTGCADRDIRVGSTFDQLLAQKGEPDMVLVGKNGEFEVYLYLNESTGKYTHYMIEHDTIVEVKHDSHLRTSLMAKSVSKQTP